MTLDGLYDEGLTRIATLHEAARRLGDVPMLTTVGLTVWPIFREQGRLRDLERATRAAADGEGGVLSYRLAVAHILAETGRAEEAAERACEVALQLADWSAFDISGPYMVVALADIAWRSGVADVADATLAWLERVESGRGARVIALVGQNCHGAIARARGLALEVLGRADEAVEQHETALLVHERLRAPVWSAAQ